MWNIFKIFKGKAVYNNILTEEDRQKALETRRLQSQVNQLEKQMELKMQMVEMKRMIEDLNGGSKGSGEGEDAFLKYVLPMLMGGMKPVQEVHQSAPVLGEASTMNPQQADQVANVIRNQIPSEAMHYIKHMSNADLIQVKEALMRQ